MPFLVFRKYRIFNVLPADSSDYSGLIDAILRDDKDAVNYLSSDLMKRVMIYLRVRMGAPESIAEECAYQAFSDVFEMIRNDRISDKKSIFKYFLTASRNEYLRFRKIEQRSDLDPSYSENFIPEPAQQLKLLIDEERQKQLKKCLQRLSDTNRNFILTFFSSDAVNLLEISEKFNFSYAKTRTLKTRIMQELQKCVEKNK